MNVLVVCPTYGRIPFLGRTLASFLSQDYDDKHLVIVNDDKNVTLKCEEKNVTVVNMNRQFLLPQKRNLAIGLNYADLIMQHDDDDIFLQGRISKHVKVFQENPHIWMYMKKNCYIVHGDSFELFPGAPVNSGSYLRSAWHAVGGYANEKNHAEDFEFYYKMPNLMHDDNEDLDYVYNWGGVNYHTTCIDDKTIQQRAYEQLIELDLVGKTFTIEPDFDMLAKFARLDELYRESGNQTVKHTEMGKFDICSKQ